MAISCPRTPTVYLLCGIVGSGKTTEAKRMLAEATSPTVIVNRDSIRTMMRGGDYLFSSTYEPWVKTVAQSAARSANLKGWDLVVDETNITVGKRGVWLDGFISERALETIMVRPKVVCVWCTEMERNLELRMRDARSVSEEKWAEVIDKMRNDFEKPTMDEGFDEIRKVSIDGKEENDSR